MNTSIWHIACGLVYIFLFDMCVLKSSGKNSGVLINFPSRTGTKAFGPANQTVKNGSDALLVCRLQESTGSSVKKDILVQWIIDGFGVGNETLKSVFDERYSMPGPASHGNFKSNVSIIMRNKML